MKDIKTVGVVGAGQMGAGIVQVSAQAGYDVLLSDVDITRAEAGKATVAKGLQRLVDREKIDAATREAVLSRITPVAGSASFASADLVIEAATEREDIKRAIFNDVGKVLREDAILASNTSSIPITRMAQASPDPERFIGIHFFNPATTLPLVEVIRPVTATQSTIDTALAFVTACGKDAVLVRDDPGFIVNALLSSRAGKGSSRKPGRHSREPPLLHRWQRQPLRRLQHRPRPERHTRHDSRHASRHRRPRSRGHQLQTSR